ncbi:MAG: peptidoglycan DD-metalloendopeptidase family protein [Caulobacter sp.]|nr:peptidoglycan DD-metalloendopeptidase family protein [Caulobacter sp.]
MRRRLATFAAVILCAFAARGAAQEPADAPSPRLMAVYSVTPGVDGAAGRAEARRQIEALRGELRRLASRQAQSSRDVASARARLQMLNVREAALTTELGRDRNRLARLLGALQLFRREPPPALLVRPEDARDAVRAAILIRAMTPALERRARAYGAEAREIAGLRRQAAQANETLFTSESLAADRRGDVEKLLTQQAAIERQFGGEADVLGREVGSPGQLADSFPRVTGPDTGPGALVRPAGATQVRRFGGPLPNGGRAEGVSFRTIPGAAVSSPAQGVVEFAGPVTGWGVILILRTSGPYHLVLAGLGEASVAPGQSVAAGAPLGRMAGGGGTGNGGRGAQELYLELRRSGTPVDPGPWLKDGGARVATATTR